MKFSANLSQPIAKGLFFPAGSCPLLPEAIDLIDTDVLYFYPLKRADRVGDHSSPAESTYFHTHSRTTNGPSRGAWSTVSTCWLAGGPSIPGWSCSKKRSLAITVVAVGRSEKRRGGKRGKKTALWEWEFPSPRIWVAAGGRGSRKGF